MAADAFYTLSLHGEDEKCAENDPSQRLILKRLRVKTHLNCHSKWYTYYSIILGIMHVRIPSRDVKSTWTLIPPIIFTSIRIYNICNFNIIPSVCIIKSFKESKV